MINVSETAAAKISELLTEENKAGSGLRVFVQGGGCSGFQYGLMIEENGQGAGDQVYESHGVKLFVAGNHELWAHDADSYQLLREELPRRIRSLGWHWLEGNPFVGTDAAIVFTAIPLYPTILTTIGAL